MFLIVSLKTQSNLLANFQRWYYLFKHILTTLPLLVLVPITATANADRTEQAAKMVEMLVFEIQDIAGTVSTDEEIYKQADDIISRYFEYETLASFTIGPYWRNATEDQKQRYLKTFRTVMVEQAAKNFDYFRTLEYRFQSSQRKGNNWIIVNGIVHDTTGQYPDAQVSWRISDKADNKLYIFDLSFENVSMIITQKDENMAVIRQNKGSLDVLIDLLAKKSIELKQSRLGN